MTPNGMAPDGWSPTDWAAGPDLPAPDVEAPPAQPVARARALAAAESLAVKAPEALTLVEALLADLKTRAKAAPDAAPGIFDLNGVSFEGVSLLDQILGSGEVTGHVMEPDGCVVAIQESVLTGVWRLHRRGRNGGSRQRWIEAGPVPAVVSRARPGRPAASLTPQPPGEGVLAARAILTEIIDRAAGFLPGQPNHVVTLTLLPVNTADLAYLKQTLGTGAVSLHVQGYGACDIDATGVDGVWSVRFMNASGTVILETLEVGGVPNSAMAAPEDFADSAIRLAEIRDAYL